MNRELEMAKLACRALDEKKGKDNGDMIVHVFDEENRLFYDLERIWRDGKVLDVNEFLEK